MPESGFFSSSSWDPLFERFLIFLLLWKKVWIKKNISRLKKKNVFINKCQFGSRSVFFLSVASGSGSSQRPDPKPWYICACVVSYKKVPPCGVKDTAPPTPTPLSWFLKNKACQFIGYEVITVTSQSISLKWRTENVDNLNIERLEEIKICFLLWEFYAWRTKLGYHSPVQSQWSKCTLQTRTNCP